jgi:hypothetical protein
MSVTRSPSDTAIPGAAAFLLCTLLAAGPAPDITASPGNSAEENTDHDPRLKQLRDTIETAFRHCDAAPLGNAFSRGVKSYLSSRALGVRQGYYGADQVLMILRRSFKGRSTVRFKLGDQDELVPQGGRRLVTARWLYRDESGPKLDARLSFTLRREGAVWHIREIREMK